MDRNYFSVEDFTVDFYTVTCTYKATAVYMTIYWSKTFVAY